MIKVHVNYVPGYDQIGVWLYETWANDSRYRHIATKVEEGVIVFEQEEGGRMYPPLFTISGRHIDEFAVAMTEALKKFLPKEEPERIPVNPVLQEALEVERRRVDMILRKAVGENGLT